MYHGVPLTRWVHFRQIWTPRLTVLQTVLSLVSFPFCPHGAQSRIGLRDIVNAAMSTRSQRGITAFLTVSCFMIHSFFSVEDNSSCS